jgi:uncharacterized metal-binding protein YceD (DUF177 family)
MKLDLRKIKDFPGKQEEFAFKLSDLALGGVEQPDIYASGCVRNAAGALLLEGRVSGVLSLVCDRCDTPFQREQTLDVSGVLSDSPDSDGNDGVFPYDGGNVDLNDIFISELILDMGMKTLCGEDCAGGNFEKYIYSEEQ